MSEDSDPSIASVVGKILEKLISPVMRLFTFFGHQMFDSTLRRERKVKSVLRTALWGPDQETRSFETMRSYVKGSGFTDAQLRKMLIEIGAVRVPTGEQERWGLMERIPRVVVGSRPTPDPRTGHNGLDGRSQDVPSPTEPSPTDRPSE